LGGGLGLNYTDFSRRVLVTRQMLVITEPVLP